MKPHKINENNLFIKGWYIDESLCDKIVNTFNTIPHRRGTYGFGAVDLSVKDSYDAFLNDTQHYSRYMEELSKVVKLYSEAFPNCDIDKCVDLEKTNVQKYNPNGGYHSWHSEWGGDSYETAMRRFVFMTYLNDVEDGGYTEFMYQNVKVKPERGLTLIWVSDWTHTHRGVTSNYEKYIITGWLSHLQEEPPEIQPLDIKVGDVIDLSKFVDLQGILR